MDGYTNLFLCFIVNNEMIQNHIFCEVAYTAVIFLQHGIYTPSPFYPTRRVIK